MTKEDFEGLNSGDIIYKQNSFNFECYTITLAFHDEIFVEFLGQNDAKWSYEDIIKDYDFKVENDNTPIHIRLAIRDKKIQELKEFILKALSNGKEEKESRAINS